MLKIRLIAAKIMIFLIKIYQYCFSPLLGFAKCRFEPSCSQYALEAFRKKGFFTALWLVCYRILRCNPFCKGGHDPIK